MGVRMERPELRQLAGDLPFEVHSFLEQGRLIIH
jgi:hypothetical protein